MKHGFEARQATGKPQHALGWASVRALAVGLFLVAALTACGEEEEQKPAQTKAEEATAGQKESQNDSSDSYKIEPENGKSQNDKEEMDQAKEEKRVSPSDEKKRVSPSEAGS